MCGDTCFSIKVVENKPAHTLRCMMFFDGSYGAAEPQNEDRKGLFHCRVRHKEQREDVML